MKEKNDETKSPILDKKENPYKGLRPYNEADGGNFYGRNEETEILFQRIKGNLLTIVFGKSGIGKTSLLNAGLFPLLRKEGFLPLPIRLNHSEEKSSLKEQIRTSIIAVTGKGGKNSPIEIKPKNEDKSASPFDADETLWEYFQRTRHFDRAKGSKVTPVLVFDQFEEFFTTGRQFNETDKDTLIDELYWLTENQFPSSFKERNLTDDETKEWFSSPPSSPDVRVIISLREDYFPHLTDLISRIPSIDRTRFRVLQLNGVQAKEIINMPGGIQSEGVTDEILGLFWPDSSEKVPFEKLEVEPSILSLICFQIVEKGMTQSFTKGDRDRILTNFYNSVMEEFPEKMKTFVEDNLLTEGGFRVLFRLEQKHPLIIAIQELINRRILRKVYLGEKEYIEIIHDVLSPIIRDKRNKRLDEIRIQSLKKRVIRRLITQIGSVALFALVGLLLYAFYQKNEAVKQYKNAQVNRLTIEALLEVPNDNTRAIRIAKEAYEMALPNPPARTYKTLSDIAYSSFDMPFYTAILQHKKPVNTAVFSPVENIVLTASGSTATLWDLEKGEFKNVKHIGEVTSAVFSTDGSRILTASSNGILKIWDLEGHLKGDFECHKRNISSAVFSPDGRSILTASWDKTAVLWDLESKESLVSLNHNGVVSSAVFSPKGDRLLTASWDKTAKLWDKQGRTLLTLPHNAGVSSAVFSPDGNRILTASEDGSATVWDLQGNSVMNVQHKGMVSSAVYSPDGRWILTGSYDGTAKIWDINGRLIKNLRNNDKVYSAEFSRDGHRVVTASHDGIVKVWEVGAGFVTDLSLHTDEVRIAIFAPDDSRILTASYDRISKIWDLEGNLLVDSIRHGDIIRDAEFSPDGRQVLTASWDKTAKLWDIKGNLIATFEHTGPVSSAVFSPDGQQILTSSMDRSVKLWNREKECLLTLPHGEGVARAVFLPGGHLILTAAVDANLKIWNRKGESIAAFKHNGVVHSINFSPDGRRILTASSDGTVKIWDVQGNMQRILDMHKDVVTSAVFSKDGRRVLTASADGTAILYDLEGKLPVIRFKHNGVIYSAAFSPDSRQVLTASADSTAKIWDLEGNLLADLNRHQGAVNSAVFSKNGLRVLTASRDRTARVWYTHEAIYRWLLENNIIELLEEKAENP